ncbi:MAG TPA: hypothetical protein VNW95_13760 [Mucilaginibacter sp.]|nr:hypothetical protein [Mucilaginibacter sp.]
MLKLFQKSNSHKIVLLAAFIVVVSMGVLLFFNPPAVFPDPGMGFQVLRSMQFGAPFNTLICPAQSDISQNYSQFLTWWSPGQYLVPYLFKFGSFFNTGEAVAITVTICQVIGLAGFYFFFKKIGFTVFISALSLMFIICQQAFVVPYVFYNGGEILLFAFEGWFLYGCAALKKPGLVLVLFVLFSGWGGFFCKSSFLWTYVAGLCCLWLRLSSNGPGIVNRIKTALWLSVPGAISLAGIYIFFLSKGDSPASVSHGLKFTLQTVGFPMASPILSGFSVDDMLHGLIFHTGQPIFDPAWSIVILVAVAVLNLLLIVGIIRYVPNENYRLFILVFYVAAILFFGLTYLRQLTISYEARHFRILGILIVPGIFYWVSRIKVAYQLFFTLICTGIAVTSFCYLVKGYQHNKTSTAKGITGLSQSRIDQPSLNYIMKLDRENRDAVFVFIGDDTGLEIMHNRIITLQPIGADLKIDADDYRYEGHAGLLYIVLPESYNGPREKMIMRSFPGYKGFNESMLSGNYVLYSAK